MSKWYGKVGYATTVEIAPSVWTEQITERFYYGDMLQMKRYLQSGTGLNDNVTISNSISIVADPFAQENFHNMRYVDIAGTKWKITDVEVQYPRLVFSIGGIYNVSDETSGVGYDSSGDTGE